MCTGIWWEPEFACFGLRCLIVCRLHACQHCRSSSHERLAWAGACRVDGWQRTGLGGCSGWRGSWVVYGELFGLDDPADASGGLRGLSGIDWSNAAVLEPRLHFDLGRKTVARASRRHGADFDRGCARHSQLKQCFDFRVLARCTRCGSR